MDDELNQPVADASLPARYVVQPAGELVNFESTPHRYIECAKRGMYSYTWDKNSCWLDSGVELFYRAYFGLGPLQCSALQTTTRSSPAFCTLLQHLADRLKWQNAEGAKWGEFSTGKLCLSDGQRDI